MSSTETIENAPQSGAETSLQPTESLAAESGSGAALDHDHDHDHRHDHDHDHEGHEHAHSEPGPVLNPECVREVRLEATAEEVDKAFARVVREYKRYAKIPGFRAGKVPENVVRRRFAGEIRKQVLESLLPERFQAAIAAAGLAPVSEPQLTGLVLEEGKALEGGVLFEVVPAFSLDGYEEVAVPRPTVEVTEEELQREMKGLRESRATMEPVEEDREIADGDWVEIAYHGLVEGESAPPVISDSSMVEVAGEETLEEFTQALRGAKVGSEVKAAIAYPEDHNDREVAGKRVDYSIQVKAVKKRVLPELNDDFAGEVGGYETVAELEEFVRKSLLADKERKSERAVRETLFGALIERYPFPVPESLVQKQVDARLDRGLRVLASQGMSTELMRNLNFARLRAMERDPAMKEVKTSLLLDRIADREGIAVTEEEVDDELRIVARQNREPVESLRARLTENGGLATIREQLRREKTASLLYGRLPAA